MVNQLVAGLKKLNVELSEAVAVKAVRFIDELLRWNKRINLTSINNRTEAIEKHLIDSLLLLNHLPAFGRLLDMGSGGGLPGIPLAIALPTLQVVSVDSVGKKINFQKHIRRMLALENLQPVCERLEDLQEQGSFDFIVARALSDVSTLVELSAPLLREGGRLLIMKGAEGKAEMAACFEEISGQNFVVTDQHEYLLPESGSERQLFILAKTTQ